MSTLIKKNGTWTKVAGHTVWMGTKRMLNAALEAGELADGTEVMVTDDYEDTVSHADVHTFDSDELTVVSGRTFTVIRGAREHTPVIFWRNGNTLFCSVEFSVRFTEQQDSWQEVCKIPDGILDSDEQVAAVFYGANISSEAAAHPSLYLQNNGILSLQAAIAGQVDRYEGVFATAIYKK